MLKRAKLEAILSKISDDQFGAIWKETYGCLPAGNRNELAKDFVAEQYDGELDGCIARAERFLVRAPKTAPKPVPRNKWLPPR